MSETKSVGESFEKLKTRLREDFFEAISNAPSVENMNKEMERRIETSLDNYETRTYSPESGHVVVRSPHLYLIAYSILRSMIPKLHWDDKTEIDHELDHFVSAQEHANYQALIFSFGVDGRKIDGKGNLSFDLLSVKPSVIFDFPGGTSRYERILIEKEIAGAPKNYLSEEDKRQIGR